jgi:hypothetical protein
MAIFTGDNASKLVAFSSTITLPELSGTKLVSFASTQTVGALSGAKLVSFASTRTMGALSGTKILSYASTRPLAAASVSKTVLYVSLRAGGVLSPPPNRLAGAMARHGAVGPIYLLDVLDANGYSYHWSSESIPSASALGIAPIYTGNPPPWNAAHLRINTENWDNTYLNWLLQSGPFRLSRSQQSDIGSFILQNMSGDSLKRSMSQLISASAFEGALFAFREWNLDAEAVEFEMHGHLTVTAIGELAEFGAEQLFNFSDYQGLQLYSETCPWRYASAACGDTTDNPCQQSWQTCRQPSRFNGIVLTQVSVQPEATAVVSTRDVVRNRQV